MEMEHSPGGILQGRWGGKGRPKSPQDPPKTAQEAPKRPQDPPRASKLHPKCPAKMPCRELTTGNAQS